MKINDEIKFILLMIIVLLSMAAMFFPPKHSVTYDCRIAEISPDIPVKVKEECRKLQEKR